MKLWYKIFLITFVLFITAFDAGIFFLSNLSYQASISTARSQAFIEYDFLTSSFSTDLSAVLSRNPDDFAAVQSLMLYYAGYYNKRDVTLELLKNGSPVAGNIPQGVIPKNSSVTQHRSSIATADGSKWLVVSGNLPVPLDTYSLMYAADITKLYDDQGSMTNELILIGIGITILFSIALFFILRRLTKPIRSLQAAADKIAAGDYSVRTKIRGHDEIADLAARFDDMTEQVAANISEQKQVAQSKQEFIDNFAHELRTPLTVIYGNAELLQQAQLDEDERIAAASGIMGSVKRMQQLSQKLLDMALTRETAIEWKTVNLSPLFEVVSDALHVRLEEKKLRLVTDCGVDSIQGDPALLQTLLLNLLDNAIKASRNDSNIFLSSYFQNQAAVIVVRDEGCGMTAEHLQKAFEPFYRTDKARSRKEGGAGLGLALCRQIADAHHAALQIESEPGKGTSVFFKITTPQQFDDDSATS